MNKYITYCATAVAMQPSDPADLNQDVPIGLWFNTANKSRSMDDREI